MIDIIDDINLREKNKDDEFCFLHDEHEMVLEYPLGRWPVEVGYTGLGEEKSGLKVTIWRLLLKVGPEDHGQNNLTQGFTMV